jgi:hypothetical protein
MLENEDRLPCVILFVLFVLGVALFCYRKYRIKESFVALLDKDEYFILGDLIKALEKEMIAIREPWFLCCGNVLGYCRHGGTIPWDDDFDVCVSQRAYDVLTKDMTKELAAKGLKVTELRDGLAKLYFTGRGKDVVTDARTTRFPFIDIFAYSIAKEGGETLRDNKGRACKPNDVHMSRATIPRCMPHDMIFPLRKVSYNIPHYGTITVPIPNKPGDMVSVLYGPGALVDCVGRYYNHDLEMGLPFGGSKVSCAELSETMGVRIENNCSVPGLAFALRKEKE